MASGVEKRWISWARMGGDLRRSLVRSWAWICLRWDRDFISFSFRRGLGCRRDEIRYLLGIGRLCMHVEVEVVVV